MMRPPAPLIVAAVALAALTGFVDVVTWIELAGFFAASMGGDMVRLGIGLAHGDAVGVRLAVALVMMFVSGVIAASVVAHRFAAQHAPPAMLTVTVALAGSAIAAFWSLTMAALLLLAFAMGVRTGVLARDGDDPLGPVSVTVAIVRMARGLAAALMGAPGDRAWAPHLLLVLGFACGGVAGAIASRASLASAVTIAAAAAAALTVALTLSSGRKGRVRRV